MKNNWMVIYKDTYNKQYNGDNNLMEILINETILYDYYILFLEQRFENFNDFLENHIAEDLDKLFDFANELNAVLDVRFDL